ncbi:hypothetical protein J2S55_008100 [Streptosporangium brasiliense]|uniref:Uncharacterized protein n=1 Tax=Streptosporangium brasiliense TaxID=47480 RepID=A0ABT9RJE5_9ACTN|nr:hypothetical protein [Streptosporangium brasiliense]
MGLSALLQRGTYPLDLGVVAAEISRLAVAAPVA